MKKATIGAALLGLLFVGCAATVPRGPSAQRTEGETDRFVWGTGITTGSDVQARFELNKHNFDILNLPSSAAPQDPPSFRDVLRGKVGQKCDATLTDGIWTLSFPSGATEPQDEVDEMLKVDEEMLETLKLALPDVVWEYNLALAERKVRTLARVGTDFVRLEKENGTESYIPLSRVDVVEIPGK